MLKVILGACASLGLPRKLRLRSTHRWKDRPSAARAACRSSGWAAPRACAVLLVCLLAPACSGSSEGRDASELLNPITDLGDGLVVLSTRDAEPGDPLIGDIRGARFFEDGAVAVLDVHEPHVKLFSPQGELTGTLGAAGEGPGELSGVLSLASGRDGSLYVLDTRGAVKRLATDGTELQQGRAPLLLAAGMGMVCGRLAFYGVVQGADDEQREAIVSLSPDLEEERREWTGAAVANVRGGRPSPRGRRRGAAGLGRIERGARHPVTKLRRGGLASGVQHGSRI